MKKLTTLLLLLPVFALPADNLWLKKDKPNELLAYVVTVGCPIVQDSIEDDVRDVLIRSRIKPIDGWNSNETILFVSIDCLPDGPAHLFDSDIYFAKLAKNVDGDVIVSHTLWGYGIFGQGRPGFIKNSVKESVEEAIADYIEANFDLGDDE